MHDLCPRTEVHQLIETLIEILTTYRKTFFIFKPAFNNLL